MEVQKTRSEGQEVGQVSQMLGQHDPTVSSQDTVQLGEKRVARSAISNLMSCQEKQNQLDRSADKRKAAKIRGFRDDRRPTEAPRTSDRWLGHLDRIEDVQGPPRCVAEEPL